MKPKQTDTIKEYLRTHKKEIEETARFMAKSNNASYDTTLGNIIKDFTNRNGTKHNESFIYNNSKYTISEILKEFRNNNYESLRFYVLLGNSVELIKEFKGTQFNLSFDLNEFTNAIMKIKLRYIVKPQMPILIVHNHPFMYRSSPSKADFNALELIVKQLKLINSIDQISKIVIVDFSIVTSFDYWSFQQAQNRK